jgi:cation:H+ antiporter
MANSWIDFLVWMNHPGTSNILWQLLILFGSIVMMSKASHIVIKNAVKIAKITKLGELVIGFILLSVATSLPEMAVSFSAIMSGNAAISIGNILGSNITNLGFVIAIPAIIAPIKIKRGTFEKLPTILFLSSIIPLFFLTMEETGVYVGVMLISTFAFFMVYSVKKKISLKLIQKEPVDILKKLMLPFEFYKSLLFLIIGVMVVIISSTYVVDSASNISSVVGVAESVVGATIIAIGTSLPELSVSLSAIRSNHSAMAIGNIIGSCLTNMTLILGVVLFMSPFTINISIFSTLLLFVIGITMVSWYFFTTGRTLDRNEGLTLLLIYIMFLISTFGVQLTIR